MSDSDQLKGQSGAGVILGIDGKVHRGEVERKMSATLMQTDCGALPMRPIGPKETWWREQAIRTCSVCEVR